MSRSVVIPLRDTAEDESIEIRFDDLPDGNEVLQILRTEKAALHYWIQLGLEYYRRGMYDDFVNILEKSGSEASLEYDDVQTDQMRALDILAAFFVRKAHKERVNKDIKKDLFGKATLLYTTADKLKMYDTPHLTGRAYFCLVEGKQAKLDQATQQFNFVLKQNPNHIEAMMGMACIAFNRKDYKTALYYYKKCLRQKPDGPADFRVGVGFCLARMGKTAKARIAFERAIEIQPTNVAALAALAIMDTNEQNPDNIQLGVSRLGLAYRLEPENPVVLVHLANHFFYRKDNTRVEQLAWHAMGIAESDQIRAEASFQLARCFHVNRDYDKAFKYYYQATTLNHPSFILPYFGLGQLHIQRGEYNQAIAAFENILKAHPNNTETLKIVGSLYAHSDTENPERRQKARDAFTKLLTLTPDDIEVLIDLAQLLESSDPTKSLQLYEKACDLLKMNENVDPPAEMINNMGSLHMHLGAYAKAEACFTEAERKLITDVGTENSDGAAMFITIRYNKARCYEHMCLFDEAIKLYKEIQASKENYVDCVMRLGCLSRDRGQIYDASVSFKEAMSINQAHADAWTLIGNLHMAKHEWGPAQKKFEHILKMPEIKHDAYSHIALGNIWLESLFNPTRDRKNDEKYIERALAMFVKVIKVKPKNIWAANGIGCVLAHKKQWQEARDIFTQVREATADFFDVWINIAHVYMETRQFVPAIQMYTNAMKKFGREHDAIMQLYLARAYYRANKMEECRQSIEKSIIEAPDNLQIKFNHAFVLKKMAKTTLQDGKSTTSMVNGAIDDLRTAERILTYISTNKDEAIPGARMISRTLAGEEARECRDLLKQAQTYLSRAKLQDELETKIRIKQEEERRALMSQMAAMQEEQEMERKRKEEEQRTLRHTYVTMTKDILKMPEIVEEKRKSGGGRKRKGGDGEEFVNDSSDMGDWPKDGEGGERRRKDKSSKKASRKRREKRDSGAGSGSDDEEDRAARKQRKKEAAARRAEQKLSAKQSAKIKSKAFLSSDSDSSDGNAGPSSPIVRERSESPAAPRMPSSGDSDSDVEEEPKKRKRKPVSDDDEDSDASASEKSNNDDDKPQLRTSGSSGSDSDAPPQKTSPTKKMVVDSDSD